MFCKLVWHITRALFLPFFLKKESNYSTNATKKNKVNKHQKKRAKTNIPFFRAVQVHTRVCQTRRSLKLSVT